MYRSVGVALLNPPPKSSSSAVEQLYASVAAQPCGSGIPSEGGPCLDANWVQAIGRCKFGLPATPGVSAGTWSRFCAKVSQCSLDKDVGCPSYDAMFAGTVPACADDKFAQTVAYCDQYPASDGPTPAMNALCWAAQKAPTFMYNAHVVPPCAGAAQAGMSSTLKWGLIGAVVVAGAYALTRRH